MASIDRKEDTEKLHIYYYCYRVGYTHERLVNVFIYKQKFLFTPLHWGKEIDTST